MSDVAACLVTIPSFYRQGRQPNYSWPQPIAALIDLDERSMTYGWICFDPKTGIWSKPADDWILEGDPDLVDWSTYEVIRHIYENRGWRGAPREWIDYADEGAA